MEFPDMNLSTLTSPLPLDYFCTHSEALSALAAILKGAPLPENVLDSIDPFQFDPKDLPAFVWYHVKCKGNVDLSSGFWKPKGGDCKLASDFPFTGFKTTYEFYEGQAPNVHKTAWVMLKYWMCRSDLPGNSKEKMSEDEILSEIDFISRGDYIELLDLDNPASPSSSSENSSCLSMSSESELKGEASSSSHNKMVSNGEETAVDGGK